VVWETVYDQRLAAFGRRMLSELGNVTFPQDLHIHTVFSDQDNAVVPEQTPELVARIAHAQVVGISDHFEHFADTAYDEYVERIRSLNMLVGTEIDGAAFVDFAASLTFDYYVYHCRDTKADYRGIERLLATGRPVIIAHPNALETNLDRVPVACLVEINNRYVWRCDWNAFYGPYRERFRFVISSDAHQPNWLSQSVARRAAAELCIQEQRIADVLAQT
jgi:histidinol phosphatase-like PHP family hydrolase